MFEFVVGRFFRTSLPSSPTRLTQVRLTPHRPLQCTHGARPRHHMRPRFVFRYVFVLSFFFSLPRCLLRRASGARPPQFRQRMPMRSPLNQPQCTWGPRPAATRPHSDDNAWHTRLDSYVSFFLFFVCFLHADSFYLLPWFTHAHIWCSPTLIPSTQIRSPPNQARTTSGPRSAATRPHGDDDTWYTWLDSYVSPFSFFRSFSLSWFFLFVTLVHSRACVSSARPP